MPIFSDKTETQLTETETIALGYFAAIANQDLDAAVSFWSADGREHVRGQFDGIGRDAVRRFLGGLFAAAPDLKMEVVGSTTEGDRCVVQWRADGTFTGPAKFQGIAPTGTRFEIEGADIVTVREGLIQQNDAFSDGMTFARQIGMLPPDGTVADKGLKGAFNLKTRLIGLTKKS